MQERIDSLGQAVAGASSVLIMPHNDPDPDAIASAVALRYLLAEKLGVNSHILYKGIIGRAENKALVRNLKFPLRRLATKDLKHSGPIALVDTQPGAGNNPLPPDITVTIVLDHHPWREATAETAFADIRPTVGSTSTILTEYLQAANLEPPPPLATALFYGIKTDTMGLIRGASPEDVAAYFYLQSRADVEALMEIERAQVPPEYFAQLNTALHAARIYNEVIASYLGPIRRPDLAAEMADLLLRLQGIMWALCLGVYKGELVLAIRTRSRRGGAGQLVQNIVGQEGTAGGHGMMASGQVPLRGRDPEQMASGFIQQSLRLLRVPPDVAGRALMG